MRPTYQQLIDGNIIGIIDAYGAVHSQFTGEELKCHADYWYSTNHGNWRWDWDKSIHWFMSESKLNSAQLDAVRNHLNKKYGIPFWDNGHHDIEYMMKQRDKQEAAKANIKKK